MSRPTPQTIRVWGDFACFTRPELKAERFSYPFITPSAARGIFDAIYSKRNEFRWQVTRIEILRLPAYIALRRNEVTKVASVASPLPIDVEECRAQRQTMALRDPCYRLTAEIRPWPMYAGHLAAFEQQWNRRVVHGKCFYQPFLGCREFACFFLPEDQAPAAAAVDYSEEPGLMLYDVFDLAHKQPPSAPPFITLFRPKVERGVVAVPDFDSDGVLKAERL